MLNFKVLFFLCWFQLAGFSFYIKAQTSYPAGIYMSWEELQKKTPSQHFAVKIEKRTQGDIAMVGGNDYKPITTDKKIKQKVLKKKVWAVADSSGLYLNCIHHKYQAWYAKVVEEKDGFLIFMAGISKKEAAAKTTSAGVFGGPIGGSVAGVKMAKMRCMYQMNMSTGEIVLLK